MKAYTLILAVLILAACNGLSPTGPGKDDPQIIKGEKTAAGLPLDNYELSFSDHNKFLFVIKGKGDSGLWKCYLGDSGDFSAKNIWEQGKYIMNGKKKGTYTDSMYMIEMSNYIDDTTNFKQYSEFDSVTNLQHHCTSAARYDSTEGKYRAGKNIFAIEHTDNAIFIVKDYMNSQFITYTADTLIKSDMF